MKTFFFDSRFQRHNWAIFLPKRARRGRYSQWRSLSGLVERYSYIDNIWFQQDGATCHTAQGTLDVLRPVFEDRIISRRANVVWPPRICYNLILMDYYLWGVVKYKCYAAALKTIFVKPFVKYSCTQSIMCLKIGPIV